MKFYDRKKELKLLQDINEQSRNNACFTVMVGRRRIGKTALLLESVRGEKFLYLFVSRTVPTGHQRKPGAGYIRPGGQLPYLIRAIDDLRYKNSFHTDYR